MDIMKKNEAVSKEFLDWIVAETRALNSSEWNIFGKCKLSFARDGRTIILPEAITISWSWSRFVSYRRRNIGPFQFYEKRLKVVIMIQPTLTKMTWALECVTCNFFWYLCCFRQGFICVTLRNKKNKVLYGLCLYLPAIFDFCVVQNGHFGEFITFGRDFGHISILWIFGLILATFPL